MTFCGSFQEAGFATLGPDRGRVRNFRDVERIGRFAIRSSERWSEESSDHGEERSTEFGTALPSEISETIPPQDADNGTVDGARKLRETRETVVVDDKLQSLNETLLYLQKELDILRILQNIAKYCNIMQIIATYCNI